MLALIRGAGDIASGAAMRLWRCGIDVVMTDLARPTAIRRTVAFSNAIVHGETTVEGLRAVRAENAAEAKKLLQDLQSRNERMFLLTFTVVNLAPTRQRLENDVFTVSGIAQKYNCALRRLDW